MRIPCEFTHQVTARQPLCAGPDFRPESARSAGGTRQAPLLLVEDLMSELPSLDRHLQALEDDEAEVREAAVEALVALGSNALVDTLAGLPQRGDLWKAVARVLGRIGTPSAIAVLTDALENDANEVCVTASLVLAEAGPEATGALLRGLQHWLPAVRARCALALGRLKCREAAELLVPLVLDAEWSVRLEAILALAAVGEDRAVPALIVALTDEEEAVRQSVPVALGEIGTPAAMAGLQQALINDDPSVRWIAEWQLNQMAVTQR